jgi:hypothetical protein
MSLFVLYVGASVIILMPDHVSREPGCMHGHRRHLNAHGALLCSALHGPVYGSWQYEGNGCVSIHSTVSFLQCVHRQQATLLTDDDRDCKQGNLQPGALSCVQKTESIQ